MAQRFCATFVTVMLLGVSQAACISLSGNQPVADSFAQSGVVPEPIPDPANGNGNVVAGAPNPAPEQPPAIPTLADKYAWIGIVGTGQSLSVGFNGNPTLDGAVSGQNNMMLTDSSALYDVTNPAATTLSMVPMAEPMRLGGNGGSYPTNIAGETPHTAMASQITVLARNDGRADYITVHSAVGVGGQPMSVIQKNGTGNAYAASLFEARVFQRFAQSANKKFAYGAVILTHGEADAVNPAYEAGLEKMWVDYNADLSSITGQTEAIPLILSQQNTEPTDLSYFSPSAQQMWTASVDYPTHVVMAGPKYQYLYAYDNLHLTSANYRRMGEKYAEVFYQIVQKGKPWVPLQPKAVALVTPRQLKIAFDVPTPPLNWDEAMPPSHQTANAAWAAGRGFEVLDSSQRPVTITAATLDANTSEVMLALATSVALPITVQYAMTQDAASQQGGTALGRHGQLRDSDPFVGRDKEDIACAVTQGSATITCATGFANRSTHDIVVQAKASIIALPSATQATLSSPWAGASGPALLTFYSDQSNYCVAFSWPVKQ